MDINFISYIQFSMFDRLMRGSQTSGILCRARIYSHSNPKHPAILSVLEVSRLRFPIHLCPWVCINVVVLGPDYIAMFLVPRKRWPRRSPTLSSPGRGRYMVGWLRAYDERRYGMSLSDARDDKNVGPGAMYFENVLLWQARSACISSYRCWCTHFPAPGHL